MRITQRVSDIFHDLDRRRGFDAGLAEQARPQRFAVDERHDVVQEAGSLSRVMERDDVRVCQASGDFDFLEEPLRAQRRGELRLEHLDGDVAVVPHISGEVHGRHATRSNCPLNHIAVTDRFGEGFGEVGHVPNIRAEAITRHLRFRLMPPCGELSAGRLSHSPHGSRAPARWPRSSTVHAGPAL